MATFAHIFGGIVYDAQVNATLAEYKARFGNLPTTAWASHTFAQVPDGTVHGAVDAGGGNYNNPVPPAPPVPDPVRVKKEIRALAAGVVGVAGLQTIIEAVRGNADTTNAAKAARNALDAWNADATFSKTEMGQIMQAFVNVSAMTAQQRTDILAVL